MPIRILIHGLSCVITLTDTRQRRTGDSFSYINNHATESAALTKITEVRFVSLSRGESVGETQNKHVSYVALVPLTGSVRYHQNQ